MEEILEKQGQTDPQMMELNFEVQTLRNKLAQASQIIERLSDERALARLNFLFKILENKDMFEKEQLTKASNEILEVMFPEEYNTPNQEVNE